MSFDHPTLMGSLMVATILLLFLGMGLMWIGNGELTKWEEGPGPHDPLDFVEHMNKFAFGVVLLVLGIVGAVTWLIAS